MRLSLRLGTALVCLVATLAFAAAPAAAEHWSPPAWWEDARAGGTVRIPPNSNQQDCVFRRYDFRDGTHDEWIYCSKQYAGGIVDCGGRAFYNGQEAYNCGLRRHEAASQNTYTCRAREVVKFADPNIAPWERVTTAGQVSHDPDCLKRIKENIPDVDDRYRELTLRSSGPGTATRSPAGTTCEETCTARYATGSTLTLRARPGPAGRFKRWTGACSGTKTTCTLKMSENRSTRAVFAPKKGWRCRQTLSRVDMPRNSWDPGHRPAVMLRANLCFNGERLQVQTLKASAVDDPGDAGAWAWRGGAAIASRSTAVRRLKVVLRGNFSGRSLAIEEAMDGSGSGGEQGGTGTVNEYTWLPSVTVSFDARGRSSVSHSHGGTPPGAPWW